MGLLDVKVGLPETKIAYASLAPNAQKKWIKVKAAYSYGSIQFSSHQSLRIGTLMSYTQSPLTGNFARTEGKRLATNSN